MTTETQEAPAAKSAPATATTPIYTLPAPRKAPRKGIPKDGLVVFVGLPKSGKNSIALSIPKCFLIETEKKGSDHLDGWTQDVNNLKEFRGYFNAALKDPSCHAIAISTIDKLGKWWEKYICEKYGIDSMSTKIEGVNQWQDFRAIVDGFIETSKSCGKLIVLLAHYKEPKLDNDGKLVIAQNVDLPGKNGRAICAEAELIGACSKAKVGNKMQFKVSFVGGGEVGAYGGRVKELEGKEIILPAENQWLAIEAACKEPAKAEKTENVAEGSVTELGSKNKKLEAKASGGDKKVWPE